ncbi:LPXTG cell wall anchor domain-containing protein [Bifidobacterium cuniculi]|uniref:LPXTG-domain and cell wall anchor domain-containing protein n=1 Tax=Bifidobacterium cuniculi TaxID=1688 RepID=A0A087AW66_9BIFI|nr:LPXTG cell wall anchor domain-containing protein [Bifidobacterium cuniculi]KFI63016.1 LPXTG-domain and cell wall anchor domain-containing protein [Bifidobacterium cuniculi]
MGRFKHSIRAAVAGVAAGATLLTLGAPAALAAGGGGNQPGTGGGGLDAAQFWQYRDGPDGSWGPATSLDSVRKAMKAANVTMLDEGGSYNGPAKAQAALDQARTECERGFNQRHPSEAGQANCRVVAVGAVAGSQAQGTNGWNGSGIVARQTWIDNWNKYVAPVEYNYAGVTKYHTSTPFWDNPSDSVNKIMERNVHPDTSIAVIVLDKYQPAPPVVDYDLTVTTNVNAPQDLKTGSTGKVSDTIHASQSRGDAQQVNANVIMHYDGNKYVGAKNVTKSVKITTKGDTRSPEFAPADFGWKAWPAGTYWFDVQVPKQGHMKAAVDTADREASESFRIVDVPPAAPVKEIEQGVSADAMVNHTVIRSDTGRGGYAMRFTDTITPNGVNYSVSNMKVLDETDNDKDISDQFTINWDKNANTVTAIRKDTTTMMPLNHTYAFHLDVTVAKPDINKVTDKGTVLWNDTSQDTDQKEFPTWNPNPDKSWIKQDASGKWAAVIDPEHTNNTGADQNVFLDGDKVASVVNGVISANLIDAPTTFTLEDDWTKADYLFDADMKGIKVYMMDAQSNTASSVYDIVNKGTDVTGQFDITAAGTKATVSMKADALKTLKGLKNHRQYTLLIPGVVNMANGKGAAQVRKDFGKQPGDELTFCETPANGTGSGAKLTNSGAQTVNGDREPTNEPWICGYVPPVKKDVIGEASQGGAQESVDGKVVFPGQKVEYQLTTTPKLPGQLAYDVKNVVVTDQYDQYLVPDKQTVEVTDLGNGKIIPKAQYTTKWDDTKHLFQLAFDDAYVKANWGKGQNPRLLIRFEGTVSKDAPTDTRVDNQWMLTLNNSITPSNQVFNTPPEFNPVKEDTQKDPSISIDGKTALLGDVLYYRVHLDLKNLDRKGTAYNVMRAGIVDDYDDEYLTADERNVEVLNAKGEDVTAKFNVQFRDGVAYVFAKTADTKVPATGETVKGDPQPKDLKAYSQAKLDPLKDPAIDQSLLGQEYTVVLPMTVTKVTDGYVVKNTATQIVNDVKKSTNTVANPLKPINPVKDVVLKVNGDSVNGREIPLTQKFLYRLDSSVIPANRAYPQVTQWGITDKLDTQHDKYLGAWQVRANRDLYKDGKPVAKTGDVLAGTGFDNTELLAAITGDTANRDESGTDDAAQPTGEQLFTVDYKDGTITANATDLFLKLVSADTAHEQAWSLFVSVQRIATSERVENTFTETFNDKELVSNTVWTSTPDLTPSIHLEKWDEKSGWPNGDRDTRAQALKDAKDGDTIVFTITNTSRTDKAGKGAVFRAKDLKLTDHTILGDGRVVDLKYPDNWDTLILKPGQSVDVKGTLKGVKGDHTDRASVSGIPLTECVVNDDTPFDGKDDANVPEGAVDIDGVKMCGSGRVVSNTDDWNATVTPPLAHTGATVAVLGVLAAVLMGGAGMLLSLKRRTSGVPRHMA